MRKTRTRVSIIVGLLIVCTLCSAASAGPSRSFLLKQGDISCTVQAIHGTTDVVSFYDYYSFSAHTPYMEDQVSKMYFYEDPDGKLSLVMHHSIDNSVSNYMSVDFDFDGIPNGAYVAVSDEPFGIWAWPRRAEFSLDYDIEGHWEHYRNADGGVLAGLESQQNWCMTINPNFIVGINDWEFLAPDCEIDLDMSKPVHISAIPTPGAFVLSSLGAGFIKWLRRRRLL